MERGLAMLPAAMPRMMPYTVGVPQRVGEAIEGGEVCSVSAAVG